MEDSELDYRLLIRLLNSGGFKVEGQRVETEEAFKKALEEDYDLILCDHVLPTFDSFSALVIYQASGLDIPVLIVSGEISQEDAIETMRLGARDFIFKDDLTRLAPVVRRELEEAKQRRLHRQTELDRIESEKQYRLLFDNSNEAIFITQDCHIKFFNPKFSRILGYPDDYFIKNEFTEILHPEDKEWVSDCHERRLQGEEVPNIYSCRVYDSQDRVRWFQVNSIYYEWEGKPATLTFATDITEQKLAEAEIRKSEERYLSIFEGAGDGIVFADPLGTILELNSAFEEITGITRDDLVGKNVLELIKIFGTPKHAPKLERFVKDVLARRKRRPFEFVFRGRIIEISVPQKVERFGITGIIRDVTERKRQDEEIRVSEARYRSLIQTVGNIIICLTTDGKIVEWNRAAEDLFETKKEKVAGKNFITLFLPSGKRESFQTNLQNVLAGEPLQNYENPVVLNDGHLRDVIWNITRIDDISGQATGVICSGQDVTDKKRIEEREKLMALFANLNPSPVLRFNLVGEITLANPAAQKMLKIKEGKQVFLAEVIPELKEIDLKECIETGRVIAREVNIEDKWMNLVVLGIPERGIGHAYASNITDRVIAEEALLEKEGFLRSIFDAIREALWVVDVQEDGEYVFREVNRSGAEIVGLSPEFFTNKKLEDALPFNFLNNTRSLLNRCVQAKLPIEEETEVEFNQQKIWVISTVAPLLDSDGEVYRVIGSSIDVTARKQAEEALKASEEQFRSLVQNQGEGAGIVDASETFLFANPAAEIIFGVETGKLKGRNLSEFMDKDTYSFVKDQTLARRRGASGSYEIEITGANGRTRQLIITATPQFNQEGKFEAIFGIFRDITERKEAERKLVASEAKYRTLFNNMLSGFAQHQIVLDAKGRPIDYIFMEINDAFTRITGLGADIIGKRVTEVLPGVEKSDPDFISIYGRVALTGKPIRFEAFAEPLGKWFSISSFSYEKGYFVSVFDDITEQKKVQEEVQRFKTIADNATYGMAIVDIQGNVIYVNEYFASVHGYSPETVHGKNLSVFHSTEQMKEVDRINKNLLRDGSYNALEVWHQHRTGYVFPMLMNGILIRDNNGKPLYIAAMATDITAIKEAEEQLTIFRRLAEASSQGIGMADLDGNIIYVNRAMTEILGEKTAEDLYRKNVQQFYTPEDRELLLQQIVPNILTGGEWIDEFPLLSCDGLVKPTLQSIFLVKNDRDEPVYLANVVTDITERKTAEEALRESEEKYRTLYDTSPDGIIISNLDGRILEANNAFLTMIGYSLEEIHGKSIFDFTPEKWHEEEISIFRELKVERGTARFEKEYIRKNGDIIPVAMMGWCLTDEAGNVEKLGAYIEDITDRKLAEKKIRMSLVEKEVLLKEIHHRVKNNLQIIFSLLALQSKNLKDSALLDVLKESQNRIRSIALVHEQLYRSHDLAQIDFDKYINRLVNSLTASYGVPTERVTSSVEASDISLKIDIAIPLGLIINELISNAYRHAFPDGQEGRIEVQLKRHGDHRLHLIVKDNGVGIPEHLDLSQSDTLGLRLIRTLSQQLESEMLFIRKDGFGVELTFPDLQPSERGLMDA